VLAPKVDEIEKKLVEILEHVDHGDEINLDFPKKGSQELIDDHTNQIQRSLFP